MVALGDKRSKLTRRRFLAAGATALLVPSVVRAKETPRIGYVTSQTPDNYLEAYVQFLRELGVIPNTESVIVRRAEGRLELIPALVRELVDAKVDVIVAPNNVAIRAAMDATQTVPIVMAASIDPVAAGYVRTLSRPGGNVTGVATLQRALSAKRLALLRELMPGLTEVVVLWDADGPGPKVAAKDYEAAGASAGLRIVSVPFRGPSPDFKRAVAGIQDRRATALIAVSNPTMSQHFQNLLTVCRSSGVALMAENANWVQAGALMSYNTDRNEVARIMAGMTQRLLQGRSPAELPVEQPTRYEFALNAQTARSLGIRIPETLAARADQLYD